MKKVIREGKVAVLVSRGFGAGWYTWHHKEELLFHPTLVDMVENGKREEITEELVNELLGLSGEYICVLGADALDIVWLPEGTSFIIEEYDGAESIRTLDDLTLVA